MSDTAPESAALKAGWDTMLARLADARDAIESPDLHAPPPTSRRLAEGYRYLLGFAFASLERAFGEDPDFPYFRRAIQPMDKATIDNADALYLSAVIDPDRSYVIRGRCADTSHWRGGPRAGAGPFAPQYAIFEVHSDYAGDTGSIVELMPGGRAITGMVDSTELQVAEDGTFEILVARERPEGHDGNFMATVRADHPDHPGRYVIVRFLYHDWEHETAPELSIFPTDPGRPHPVAATPQDVAARMERAGTLVANQMRFWNEFYDVVLGGFGEGNPDALAPMPRNGVNTPAPAALATGGGQSTNVYCGGRFHLQEGEALLLRTTVAEAPAYQGLHLSNLWGESLDYANNISSLNGHQAEAVGDATTYVISSVDPGVPNWLDTTGQEEGFISMRWTYHAVPEVLPTAVATKIRLAELAHHLPAGTRSVSAEERAREVQVRREHVQRRYRQY